MTELDGLDYLGVFLGTLALTLVLTPLALRVALRRRILDHPSEIKAQESPVPYLGGVAIVTSFSLVVVAAAILLPPQSNQGEVFLLIGLALALAVVGLLDDLRGLSPYLRLAVEIAAAYAVFEWSTGASLFENAAIDLPITIIWIVGVTNALNLLDNMDGLSAGVAAIAAGFLFVVAVDNGQFLVATLAAGLTGCAAGFLRSNFHPARIYMGDAGALFLGFLLAVLGLRLRFEGPQLVTFFVPILILGIALFDTALVVVNRLIHGRSPVQGGRDHTSHRLVFIGIPIPAAVSLIYAGAVSLGWLAVVMARLDQTTGLVLMSWVIGVAVFAGVALSLVPVYETSRRRHVMLQEVTRHEPEPPAGAGRPAAGEAEAS